MQEPIFVRASPIALFYAQFVMAALLGALIAQHAIPSDSNFHELELVHLIVGMMLMWPIRPLVKPLFRLVGADHLPSPCPVCAQTGYHHPRQWIAFYGEPSKPESWKRLCYCPRCREAAWVYFTEHRIVYSHPPEFRGQSKILQENWWGGRWDWAEPEECWLNFDQRQVQEATESQGSSD